MVLLALFTTSWLTSMLLHGWRTANIRAGRERACACMRMRRTHQSEADTFLTKNCYPSYLLTYVSIIKPKI